MGYYIVEIGVNNMLRDPLSNEVAAIFDLAGLNAWKATCFYTKLYFMDWKFKK